MSVTLAGCPPSRVAAWLHQTREVAVRAGLHCAPGAHRTMGTFPAGTVRFSPGWFTTADDIARALEALREAAQTLGEGRTSTPATARP